ncbi:MAG: hypothetical protein COV79_02365 [Parcubacteria group bacterium CG11_big_fil_rev_8_21_14_0_20_41_14]|nr:MAG: hypothetical protein COV79_02365 [Parcubacteria group bacterium CG11_big_fil_rev_8_21_14_0_20_41_14]
MMTLTQELIGWAIFGLLIALGFHKTRTMHFLFFISAWYAFAIWRAFLPWWVKIPQETWKVYSISIGILVIVELLIFWLGTKLQGPKFSFPYGGNKTADAKLKDQPENVSPVVNALNRGLAAAEAERQKAVEEGQTGKFHYRVTVGAGNDNNANLIITLPNGTVINKTV